MFTHCFQQKKVFAHRGCNYNGYTQNTIKAFQQVIQEGASVLELDIQCSADGELFVYHDFQLEQFSNGKGLFAEQTSEYIKSLLVGNCGSHTLSERIPHLSEILNILADIRPSMRPTLNIELKGKKTAAPLCRLLNQYIQKSRLSQNDIMLSSFLWDELYMVRQIFPSIRVIPIHGAIRKDVIMSYFDNIQPVLPIFFLDVGDEHVLCTQQLLQNHRAMLREHISDAGKRRRIRDILHSNYIGKEPYIQDYFTVAHSLDAYSLNFWYKAVTKHITKTAHAAGFFVYAYTVNNKWRACRMRALGVDGIFTDYYAQLT